MRITAGCDDVPEVGNPQISSSNFTFDASGQPSTIWGVYSSTNLTNWTSITNLTLDGSGAGSFTDSSISGIPYRFYKLSDSNCCSQAIGFTRIQVGTGTLTNLAGPGTNTLIVNQLDMTGGNTLDNLFNVNGGGAMIDGTALVNGSAIQKWDVPTQAFVNYTWNGSLGSGWRDASGNSAGNISLNPGEGGFLYNVGSNAITVTFAGLVRQGALALSLPAQKYQIISSLVPKQGGIQTDLGYVPNAADQIQQWTGSAGYVAHQFSSGSWTGGEPVLSVGQAVFWHGRTNNVWQINFSPCQ